MSSRRAPQPWRAKRRWRRRAIFSSSRRTRRSVAAPSELAGRLRSLTRLHPYNADQSQSTGEKRSPRAALRLTITAVVILGLFCTLIVRLYSLQVVQGPALFSAAKGLTTRTIAQSAPRGLICARAGCTTQTASCAAGSQVLASDQTFNVATLTRTEFTNDPSVITRLAQILGTPGKTLSAAVTNEAEQYSPSAPLPVAGIPPFLPAVTPEVIAEIAQHQSEFPGVTFSETTERCYPYNDLGSQAIGYVGAITAAFSGLPKAQQQAAINHYEQLGYSLTDNQFGLSGLESQYQSALRGKDGTETVEVNPLGNPVGNALSKHAPQPGNNLILNLDLGLQQTATTALTNEMNALHAGANKGAGTRADWGAAVVLDAHSGAVLAMDSYPNYDANEWVPVISTKNYQALLTGRGEPLNNYAITGLQAPGSTFKLATATAALNDGLISAYSTINDPGFYKIGTLTLNDADAGAMGYINVTTALERSSDVFFYTLGGRYYAESAKYGKTPIQNAAAQYGLGRAPGIDLPGAASGQVDSQQLHKTQHAENPKAFPYTTWYPGDDVELAFGQGETLATPIQIASAYAAFANGGTRYAPEMAAGVVSATGKVVQKIAPKVAAHVKLPGAAGYAAMLAGFKGAVQNPLGTAYGDFTGFDFSKWDIAGKTGTATSSPQDKISPTAWFVAFGGPSNQSPKYVVAVEIDRAGFGADAAAPVARKLFDYLYAHPVKPANL